MTALMLTLLAAHAAPIQWGPARDTTDVSQVGTVGALVEAINLSSSVPHDISVNGVPFSPETRIFGSRGLPAFVALDGATTGDDGLDLLVGDFDFGGSSLVSFLVGEDRLIPGHEYRLQVFYTDVRSCCAGRLMEVSPGSANAVTLSASGHAFNALGQHVIGTFVADDTEQELTVRSLLPGHGVHLNGFQLRDITPGKVRTQAAPTAGATLSGRVTDLPPGHDVTFVMALTTGSTPVRGCAGESLGLGPYVVAAHRSTDASGMAQFTTALPQWLGGSALHVQVVDRTDCTTGPVTTFQL